MKARKRHKERGGGGRGSAGKGQERGVVYGTADGRADKRRS